MRSSLIALVTLAHVGLVALAPDAEHFITSGNADPAEITSGNDVETVVVPSASALEAALADKSGYWSKVPNVIPVAKWNRSVKKTTD